MKTTEKIKSEVVNYLNETAKHLFVSESDWKKVKIKDFTDIKYYKVLVEGDNFITISGESISIYNINDYISWYGANAKCVIKHELFLNKKLRSIPSFKIIDEKMSTIKQAISGKTDRIEISKIISNIIKPVEKSLIYKLFKL
jgi:hypothetical protein